MNNELFNLGIYLILPISLYINYLTYIKNLEKKENQIIYELTIVISILFLTKICTNYKEYFLIIYIPVILSILKNNKKTFLLANIIFLSFTKLYIPVIISCIIILILNKYLSKNKIYISIITSEILIYIFMSDYTQNIFNELKIIIVYIIFIYFCINFLEIGNNIKKLSIVLKELEREKLLRTSISKLTHELKNPIAVCKGYLEMFNLNNKDKSEKYLEIIKKEIDRSKTIIEEFSDYGKLKKIEKEEMDLSILLYDINDMFQTLFSLNKAKLIINNKKELYINGDYNKLKQVLVNMIKNSFEARTTNDFYVKVTAKDKKRHIEIEIIDNGVGISEENLTHIFDLFYTTKDNGTGIGLAYSKEIIELHNGNIEIKSIENQGTTIKIKLPK